MEPFIRIYIVLIGLVIGSFLNVLIYRIPLKQSVVKGSSNCPRCSHRLNWLDLFPLLSYLFLRGKCRYCKSPISPRYPAVEAANAVCYYLIYINNGLQLSSLLYAVVCSSLIVLGLIDYDHKIIPNRFHIIVGVCALLLALISRELTWIERLLGMFSISVPLFVIALFTGGIGEGDVKLFAVCGFLLGWKLILLTMLLSSFFAAVYGITLMVIKRAKGKTEIPFGPFIAFAVLVCMFAGDRLINLYLSLISK